MFDWNDLKAFLAVARNGSTLAASKALRVNQTTVARRVEGLEVSLGLKLFERGQSGSRLTEAGRDLMAEAEKVEQASLAFSSRAASHQRGLEGSLRITCTEIVGNTMLAPALAEFHQLHPEIQIDLILSDRMLDIEAGEADLAVRTGEGMPVSDLLSRKLIDYDFALYCSRDYAARKGVPASLAVLGDHDLIGGEGSTGDLPGMAWMFQQAGGKPPVVRSNTMTSLMHAVTAGIGVAPLPSIVADANLDLVRCTGLIAEVQAHSWIIMRREGRDLPRIRAFVDFLVPYVQRDAKARLGNNRRLRQQAGDNDEGPVDLSSPA